MTAKPSVLIALCGVLAACAPQGADVSRQPDLSDIGSATERPVSDDPNACFGAEIVPAIIETVTERKMIQPGQVSIDGKVYYPAVYKNQVEQRVIRERTEVWFETPCPASLTPDFIASVQRALAARDHYRGPINGEFTLRTRRAIRAFQQDQGLDSDKLSLETARILGLIAYDSAPAGG